MSYWIARGDEVRFPAPSWRPNDTTRGVTEISEAAGLRHSRANLFRYSPGSSGLRHAQLVQEEIFVVLEGILTLFLGEPPEQHDLPPRSVAVVHPKTPVKVANVSESDVVFFVYGAPEDPSVELLEASAAGG